MAPRTETSELRTALGVVIAAGMLVAEMRDAGVADPLATQVTLAAVFADLFRLAGLAETPADVRRIVG